jgi:hypothetical protein
MISSFAFLVCFFFLSGSPDILHAEDGRTTYPVSAWPFVYHKAEQDQGETDILWPFYRSQWRGPWKRYAVRPLIFSTESDPSRDFRKTSVLWPLNVYEREGEKVSLTLTLYWYRNEPERFHRIFFPVYWNGWGKDYSYYHLWPLFGVNRKDSYSEHSTLYPFFRYGEDPNSSRMKLDLFWPIFNYQTSPDYMSHRALPLYWYEKGSDTSGGFVFPYYWRNTASYQARGVIPLWYSSRGEGLATDVVFPLYYNREKNEDHLRLIFPLYGRWKNETASLQTFFPLYWDYRRADFALRTGLPVYLDFHDGPAFFTTFFPFYYRAGNTQLPSEFTYYFPVYGTYRIGQTYSRHLLFMPLYSRYRDDATRIAGWDVMWPMLHYETGPDRRSVRVFPLLWYTRSPQERMTFALPLYFSYAGPESSYFHIIPFYGVNKKGSNFEQRFVLGPVYIDTQDPSRGLSRQDIVFPIFSRMKVNTMKRSWLFPFYYHREKPDSRITFASPCLLPPYYLVYKDDKQEYSHIWPFYGHLQQGTYEEYSALWPIILYGSDSQTGEKSYTVAPLWWHRRSPEMITDASLILHSYTHDEKLDKTKSAFIWLGTEDSGVFTYEREKDEKLKARFLWQVVSYERTGADTKEFRFLWRLVRKSAAPRSEVLELNPLYYRETDAEKGTTYRAFLGGLIGSETMPDGQKRMRYLWGL